MTTHAFGWLAANENLAVWLSCFVTGNSATGRCVRSRLNGTDPILVEFGDGRGGFHSQKIGPSPRKVEAYKRTLQRDYHKWIRDYPDQEECVTMDLAATMLHEILHTCGGYRDAYKADCSCEHSFILENSFRYALSKRYPCIAERGSFCYFWNYPEMWLHDGLTYPLSPPFRCSHDNAGTPPPGAVPLPPLALDIHFYFNTLTGGAQPLHANTYLDGVEIDWFYG